jgi:hypothetical protein
MTREVIMSGYVIKECNIVSLGVNLIRHVAKVGKKKNNTLFVY